MPNKRNQVLSVIVIFCVIFSAALLYENNKLKEADITDEAQYLLQTHAEWLVLALENGVYNDTIQKELYYVDAYAQLVDDEDWLLLDKALIHFAERETFEKLSPSDVQYIASFLKSFIEQNDNAEQQDSVEDFYARLHAIYYPDK